MNLKVVLARLEVIERVPVTPSETDTTLRDKVRQLIRDIEIYLIRTTGTL